MLAAAFLAVSTHADAQLRGNRQNLPDRQDAARAQGVPPGQMPPADRCRVWYEGRPPGRQPSATSCSQAEALASRDRSARVIYGENVYSSSRAGYGNDPRFPDDRGRDVYNGNDRAVRRDGRVRDPRVNGGTIDQYGRDGRDTRNGRDSRYGNTPAFESGYRDGLTKGREDGEDNDRFDAGRHSWYRSANRGYDDDFGSKADYQSRYRQGFNAGYAEGYRVYARR